MTYPSILTSSWYRHDVFKIVPANLRGMGEWYSKRIENLRDREAYQNVVDQCISACKNAWDINNALDRLYTIEQDLMQQKEPSIFTKDRWIGNAAGNKLAAVKQCIEVAKGIRDRYHYSYN